MKKIPIIIIIFVLFGGPIGAQKLCIKHFDLIRFGDTLSYEYYYTPCKLLYDSIVVINCEKAQSISLPDEYDFDTRSNIIPDSIKISNGEVIKFFHYVHPQSLESINYNSIQVKGLDTIFVSYGDSQWEKEYKYSPLPWSRYYREKHYKNMHSSSLFSPSGKMSYFGLDSLVELSFVRATSSNEISWSDATPKGSGFPMYLVKFIYKEARVVRKEMWQAEASNPMNMQDTKEEKIMEEHYEYLKGKISKKYFIDFRDLRKSKVTFYVYKHDELMLIEEVLLSGLPKHKISTKINKILLQD